MTAQNANTTPTVLHIDASQRRSGSTTRALTARLARKFAADGAEILRRDLADTLPLIDEAWIGANFTQEDARSDAQRAALALSDRLIDELKRADTIVIGAPIYNFGVPAGLKAWIDLIARARVTFRYTEDGPVGLLEGKRAIIVAASGGTAIGSDIDFATPWLRHVLGFIGITDVTVIIADRQMSRGDTAVSEAEAAIDRFAA